MFTKEPEEFSSFREELTFEYSQEESAELIFEIELSNEEESKEVKKLYDSTTAIINIAPIVANAFMPTPADSQSSLTTPDCGVGQVKLSCGQVQTTPKYFVAAKGETPEIGPLTDMPKNRLLSYGDADEVWLRATPQSVINIEVETQGDAGSASSSFEHTVEECGVARFVFNTVDFSSLTSLAKLYIYCDQELIGEVIYIYVPRSKVATRVAWIGKAGAVEHYTFPVTSSISMLKSGIRQYTVESDFEASNTVAALADIVCSERLWVVEGGEYIEVQLLSDQVTIFKNGALSTVEYKFERYD